jgi:hypothetical protein
MTAAALQLAIVEVVGEGSELSSNIATGESELVQWLLRDIYPEGLEHAWAAAKGSGAAGESAGGVSRMSLLEQAITHGLSADSGDLDSADELNVVSRGVLSRCDAALASRGTPFSKVS